jgi:lipopolysaccharide transport system ATP-binding protein
MTLVAQDPKTVAVPNDSEVVLSVQGVSKKFCRDFKRALLYGVSDISQEVFGLRGDVNDTLRKQEFWALQDVSFELRRGEALGLVGKNGSGKSTLLRVIAGLIKPDVGTVKVKGRVAPLIALGAGFNPVLTGRENIYANMSILGLTKEEIGERFDEVVEFAEITDAIDAPVRSYSSGMAARLGFASAIFTEPDILLIDEVLAVGDSKFRGKCFQKLHQMLQKGVNFILVSHDSHSILSVCDQSIYLKKGKFMGAGDSSSVLLKYEHDLFFQESEKAPSGLTSLRRREAKYSTIQEVFFRDHSCKKIDYPQSGEETYLCVRTTSSEEVDDFGITFAIKGLGSGSETVLLINSLQDNKVINLEPGECEIRMKMPYLGLTVGSYIMDIFTKKQKLYHLDAIEGFRFDVKTQKRGGGRCLYYQPREWDVLPDHCPDTQL